MTDMLMFLANIWQNLKNKIVQRNGLAHQKTATVFPPQQIGGTVC